MQTLSTPVPFLDIDVTVTVDDAMILRLAAHGLKQKLGDAAAVTANKSLKSQGYTSPKYFEVKREAPDDAAIAYDAAMDAVSELAAAIESGDFESAGRGDRLSSMARERLITDIKARPGCASIPFTTVKKNSKGKETSRAIPFKTLAAAYAEHLGKQAEAVIKAYIDAVRPAYEAILAAERTAAAAEIDID